MKMPKWFKTIVWYCVAFLMGVGAVYCGGCCLDSPEEEPTDADFDGDVEVNQDGTIWDVCEEGESVCRCHEDFPTISFVARCDRGGFRVAYACGEREACVNTSLSPPRVQCVPLLQDEVHPCE